MQQKGRGSAQDPHSFVEYVNQYCRSRSATRIRWLATVADMRATLALVLKCDEFDEIKQDVEIIKAAVTDLSRQMNGHEFRISWLEAA